MRRLIVALCLSITMGGGLEAAEKWALLIGVNDYTKGPAQWDLRGCENDVVMTKEILTTKYGFPPENVKTLLSAEATVENIVSAIENWLIAQAVPEDIVYFHFSGHGSQTKDSEGDEEDGLDELLCPSNMELGDVNTIITDDQLRELFARIRANNVTIVMDACHSGTGTRDLSLSRARYVEFDPELRGGGTRAVVMTAAPASAPAPTTATSVSAHAGSATAAGSAASPAAPQAATQPAAGGSKLSGSGGMEGGSKLQVSISGCRSEQTSADAWIRDDFYAGALTHSLIENMKKAPADITYRELMDRVVRDVKAQKHTQIPQIEGDMDRPLFGTAIEGVVETPFLVVQSVQGSRVTLNGGKGQHVTRGSRYALFPGTETAFRGSGLGMIQISSVAETSCEAQVLGGARAEEGFRAKELLHNPDPEALKLLVEGPAAMAGELAASLESVSFAQVVSGGEHFDHRLQVSQSATGVQASLTMDGAPGVPVQAADVPGLVTALRPRLENAYSIKYLANLDNPCPAFGVEIWANTAPAGTRDLVVEALDEAEDEKMVQARLGDVIRFNFKADRDCYLTLINVGTSGKITVLFPNKYRPDGFIQAGRVYQTETRGEMPFKIRASGPAGSELVKVVATLEPLDLSSLKMGEAGGAGTRSIESGSQFAQQLARDLAAVGATAPTGAPNSAVSGAAELAGSESGLGEEGTDVTLLPTDSWATDYLIIETTP